MPHDIIDNREVKLSDQVGLMLDNAARAKFAVGYFFLSGFKAIREHLEKVEELRLLIGSTSNKETVEALTLGLGSSEAAAKAIESRKYLTDAEKRNVAEEAAQTLSKVAAQVPQTDEDEDYIKHLVRLVREGRIKVRVYTKCVLHAKAYIVDYPEGRFERGSAIIGSSNLSLSGVESNTELNVVVPGNDNHEKLSKWFDDLWNDSEEFSSELMHVLESSWAVNEPTPYELYLKIIYELVKDRLDKDEKIEAPREAVELYNYQKDAVLQARSILNDYDGVFLCDVVGLGKTYMGAALLADHYARTGEKALVICPAVLIPQWESVCDLYDLPVSVVSRGKVTDIEENPHLMKRPVVLVDESHHFRHPYTQSYKALERICWQKKVVLVTATPYNTEADDIRHQMRLFTGDKTDIPIDPPTLTEYFGAVAKGERKLPDLLEHVMVRRTRKHIEKYYPEDMKGGKLKFPKRLPPVRVDYSIDEVYPGIYDKLEKLLKQIRYARYDLYHYVKPQHRDDPELSQLQTASSNLVALMKTMLFKRMESSVAALRRSVSDQAEIHQLYLDHLKKGSVPAGLLAEELNRYRETGDDDKLEEVIELSAEKYPAEKFEMEELKKHIEADLAVFRSLHDLVKDLKAQEDAKLQTLLKLLEAAPFKDNKVLIFTQFATTADYLGEQVSKRFDKSAWVSGSSKDVLDKVKRFAPKANQAKITAANELRILVTTDILAEGLNLQDGNIVLSYDLHWNPVRLIQRIGRVDRVSTEHEEIHTYNFFPERKLEEKLLLEDRLTKRFDEIHKHLGLDSQHLSKAEQLTDDVKLFKRIYEGDEKILAEEGDEADVSFAELVKILRDLRKNEPALFKKVTELPDKMRSATHAPEDELAVFCKAGEYAALYLADKEGRIISQDQLDILKKLRCEPNTKRAPLPKGFNAQVREIEAQFQEDASQRLAERRSVSSEPIVRQTLKRLTTLARKAKKENKAVISEVRARLEHFPLTPAQRTKLRGLSRQVNTPDEEVAELNVILLAQKTLVFEEPEKKASAAEVVVQVIASEALVKK